MEITNSRQRTTPVGSSEPVTDPDPELGLRVDQQRFNGGWLREENTAGGQGKLTVYGI